MFRFILARIYNIYQKIFTSMCSKPFSMALRFTKKLLAIGRAGTRRWTYTICYITIVWIKYNLVQHYLIPLYPMWFPLCTIHQWLSVVMHESLLLLLQPLSGLDNHQIFPIGGGDHLLYPLFPPDLIPGMVRKMWIVSGVPYSQWALWIFWQWFLHSFTVISIESVSMFLKETGRVNLVEKSDNWWLKGATKSIQVVLVFHFHLVYRCCRYDYTFGWKCWAKTRSL